jgi:TolB-like protein/Flp pilus assembly protein TadD
MSFLGEVKRRKIFQVAAVYAVVAWLLIQIVATIEEPLNLPSWFDAAIIVLLAVGFPITLIMSWGLNLTPEGIVKEGEHAPTISSKLKIEYVLLGLVIVALVWLVYRVEFDRPGQALEAAADGEQIEQDAAAELVSNVLPNSIAVLPFENLSPDPGNAYFAAGIHESTLNQLAKISDLVVLSRTSVLQYAEERPPIPEIVRALNVAMVMEGSVRYANDRVLITAQLIDGATDAHLWSEEFNRELSDVFSVQSEVARRIAETMQIHLTPDEQARIDARPTESNEAYKHYLHAISLPFGVEYRDERINSLLRAIDLDREFSEAYAELAFMRGTMGANSEAINLAEKAIALRPDNGLAHQILGNIYADYFARQDESRDAFQHAVEVSPNAPQVLAYYCYRAVDYSKDYDAALRFCQRAIDIDPTRAIPHLRLGFVLMRAGRYAEAIASMEEAIEIDPVTQHQFYIDLAIALFLKGDSASATQNLDRAVDMLAEREVFRVDYIAYVYGLLGETGKAEKLVARFESIFTDADFEAGRTLGWGYLGTRDKARALADWSRTVERYIDEGEPVSPGRISRFRDNWLDDPMLEEPEFLELRRRLGYEG